MEKPVVTGSEDLDVIRLGVEGDGTKVLIHAE